MEKSAHQLLPDFGRPPVAEVALSVQFDPVKDMGGPQVGLLWAKFRSEFPKVDEHPPLDQVIESFGSPLLPTADLRLECVDAPVSLRTWFLNERGDELIQVQQDRFIHNWHKVDESDEYPRYSHLISTFTGELGSGIIQWERLEHGVPASAGF